MVLNIYSIHQSSGLLLAVYHAFLFSFSFPDFEVELLLPICEVTLPLFADLSLQVIQGFSNGYPESVFRVYHKYSS